MKRKPLWICLLVSALLLGGAILFLLPCDSMRPHAFVGRWRLESPLFQARPELVVEIDIILDGTIRDRLWNSHTGVVEYQQLRSCRWHVSNGRFQEVIKEHSPSACLEQAADRGSVGITL
jgi:hypothetical protein